MSLTIPPPPRGVCCGPVSTAHRTCGSGLAYGHAASVPFPSTAHRTHPVAVPHPVLHAGPIRDSSTGHRVAKT
eukprot:2319746-Rhodomonas_salina.5